MTDNKRNDWEFPIDNSKIKEKKDYDLNGIYEHAHSELSLQQSKRDQIITIYLALCSFLIPFALGETIKEVWMKGIIFIMVGIVGVLFSYIAVRYREYKEVYWLCCQTLTVMLSFKTEELDKSMVQRSFYHCLHKKGKKLLKSKGGELLIDRPSYVKKNLFSSETLHYIIIVMLCSFIAGLGVALTLGFIGKISIALGVLVGILVLIHLLQVYFKTCINVYAPLEKRESENTVDIKKTVDGYFVTLRVMHKNLPLMELTLYAVDLEQAEQLKSNFLKDPAHVYSTISASLFI
jgi:hypothetical protein